MKDMISIHKGNVSAVYMAMTLEGLNPPNLVGGCDRLGEAYFDRADVKALVGQVNGDPDLLARVQGHLSKSPDRLHQEHYAYAFS